jgi:DNA-directed RNA polymerase beta' subunit
MVPTQDMVLGCYYLTTFDQRKTKLNLQKTT